MSTYPSDPSRALFEPDAIDPATRQFNAELEKLITDVPPVTEVPVAETRRIREAGEGLAGPLLLRNDVAHVRTIPGPAGDIPLRIFTPDNARGVYFHIHGGGWTIGGAHHQDPLLWELATRCQVAVVSVEYRLAPEHPYPAGPDDCEAAALWLIEHARAEFGTEQLILGGESAGAHLCAVTLLRLRDRHGFSGFRGASLAYGMYDFTFTPSVRNWGPRNLVLSTPIIEWFCDQFVPPARRSNPDVSPLYADLAGMPPALFTIGTLDPLLDDTLFMYERWRAAGNPAELAVYPGGVHGFVLMPCPLAAPAVRRIQDFLASVL
jgi:acetyl esterase/lipase